MKAAFLSPLLIVLSFLVAQLSAEPPNTKAWVSQNLISPLGKVITYETALHSDTGTMESVPLNGFLARFDLYVYPLIGVDGEDPTPEIVDSEVVGILPKITMEFHGKDPHEEPRTRADWEHRVTTTIIDSPVSFDDPLTIALPTWVTRFVLRKRFLREEYIGVDDGEDHWEEYSSLPVVHVSANQEITFSDKAYPPNLTAEEQDRWSGIIEYQLALDNVIGNPLPLLTLDKLNVRVWPKWRTEFVNIPTETVYQFPSDMRVDVFDIYPGTEKVVVDYFYDPEQKGHYEGLVPVNLVEEPWSATVAQDRKYSLAALSNQTDGGDYHIRVGYLLFGEMEYADDQADTNGGGEEITTDPPDKKKLTLGENKIRFRGGLFGFE